MPAQQVQGGMCVVDARDVAQAMLTAIEKGKSGERYIVSGGYLAIADVLKTLEKVSGVSAPTRHIPYTVTIVYASVLEWIGRVTGKPVLISREAVRLLHMKRKVISDKARRELAATSRPFEETIRDEIAWYRTHQHL